MLIENARTVVLNTKARIDCSSVSRRISRVEMPTSAVWAATAIVKE